MSTLKEINAANVAAVLPDALEGMTEGQKLESRGAVGFRTELRTSEVRVTKTIFPLSVPRYSGDGRTSDRMGLIHPDVIVLGTAWNGYTHWKVVTPYPGLSNAYENPSIYCSNNGIDWMEPAGITNPIATFPGSPELNSDPCLVMVDDVLYCIYRYTDATPEDHFYYRSSSDGATWSAAAELFTLPSGASGGISPTILHDGTQFVCYHRTSGPTRIVRRTCPTINGTWSAASTVSYPNNVANTTYPIIGNNSVIWHLQAFLYGGKTYMVAQIPDSGATFGFDDGRLYIGESTDGLTFEFNQSPIMSPGEYGSTTPGVALYRSCVVPVVQGGDLVMKMWFSTEAAELGYAELTADGRGSIQGNPDKLSGIAIRTASSAAVNNSTTLVSDSVLKAPLKSGVTYKVTVSAEWDTSNTTTGMRVGFIPSSADVAFFKGTWVVGGRNTTTTTTEPRMWESDVNGGVAYVASTASTQNYTISGEFIVQVDEDLDLALAYAQNTANATNSLLALRSWIRWEAITSK